VFDSKQSASSSQTASFCAKSAVFFCRFYFLWAFAMKKINPFGQKGKIGWIFLVNKNAESKDYEKRTFLLIFFR